MYVGHVGRFARTLVKRFDSVHVDLLCFTAPLDGDIYTIYCYYIVRTYVLGA